MIAAHRVKWTDVGAYVKSDMYFLFSLSLQLRLLYAALNMRGINIKKAAFLNVKLKLTVLMAL